MGDPTLAIDRGRKLRINARAGVAAYWVLNLGGWALHADAEPAGNEDGALRTYRQGMVALPWRAALLDVADLLP
jgi:hypothetical protein